MAGTVTEAARSSDPGVDPRVGRLGGISYVRIPAPDPRALAAFYATLFGWEIHGRPEQPHFDDGTGHVIGAFVPDREPAGDAGVLPYVFVRSVDETLALATAHGGSVAEAPYAEGGLRVATFRDPAGNVVGVWQIAAEDAAL